MDLSRYTIQGSQDVAKVLAKNNLHWITLRWYYMVLLAAIAIAVTLLGTFSTARVFEYVVVLLSGYGVNVSLLLLVKKAPHILGVQRFALAAQLLLDLLMGGVIIYIQGGVDARTTVLFAIPIIASGLAFIRQLVLVVAALSGVVYIATIILHGALIRGGIDWVEYAVPMIFYPLLFLVLARIVEFLTTIEINDIRERTYNSFLSLLAHQLKHPASASKTIIDAIQHDDSAHHTDQTAHYLQLLRGESENQIRLIDNLLEAAPRQSVDVHLEPINIVLLVEKVAHQVARGHQRAGDLIRVRGTGETVIVQGNPIKLQLALTNVFDNAFRHTNDNTAVHYGIKLTGTTVEIKVADDGEGVEDARPKSMTERFSVSAIHDLGSRHVGGLGLGLYVAQHIITAHEGTLAVQSKKGHGTQVTIRMKGARK